MEKTNRPTIKVDAEVMGLLIYASHYSGLTISQVIEVLLRNHE